ncbi:hypothetical protein Sinac_4787 [Singulisphaera acidiphila DSM 18658]|uniref:Thioredoxin domain-containing protein n=2 Tax=Singulisphaera acidiphila TaxID=466153 RepID=L0DJD4_SINAD|nr:hypothetical protein Sinac_4787 [Singulisphaera acidiphila DSM 18658]
MALVTTVVLAWTAWLRFGGEAPIEPPTVGAAVPPLRLLDAATSQPIVLVGLRGRVVWITFWSSNAPAEFAQLDRVWGQLGSRRGFSMVAAAVDAHAAGRVRTLIGQAKSSLPVYLASPETCRTFGATAPNLPLHLLIDEDGHVGAIAHGAGSDTFSRLAEMAERWLDEREPLGKTRFAINRRREELEVF